MARCLIALGGNLNASESLFDAALGRLQRPEITPVQRSEVISTCPVGTLAGNEFLNAAATLECTLEPGELLSALHEVETAFGRTRTLHWGPRTLDLDLLLFDQRVMDQPDLVIPHPAMWYRRFVLDPAVQVAPEMAHPILKQTISELHRELHTRPIRLAVFPADRQTSNHLDLKRVLEQVAGRKGEIEWFLSEHPSRDFQPCFSSVAVHGESARLPHRTQPANARSRLINIFADTDDSAIDQLTELSAAILGDTADG